MHLRAPGVNGGRPGGVEGGPITGGEGETVTVLVGWGETVGSIISKLVGNPSMLVTVSVLITVLGHTRNEKRLNELMCTRGTILE